MDEKEWAQSICDKLNDYFSKELPELHAETQVPLPYSQGITYFDENWKQKSPNSNTYRTDLLIYESQGENRIPLIVIESKFKKIDTHNVIIYNEKAGLHKLTMPSLHYGIMFGSMGKEKLSWRVFTHGGNFDFMFYFKSEVPAEAEWNDFIELIKTELKNIRNLKKMNDSAGNSTDIHWLQRNLFLK